MSGAPYPEDEETRRRVRYAVVSGLAASGFAPEDEQHIGYLRTRADEQLPKTIPYEEFMTKTDKKLVVFWLDEDMFRKEPLFKFDRLMGVLKVPKMRIVGPRFSQTLLGLAQDARNLPGKAHPGSEVQKASEADPHSEATKKCEGPPCHLSDIVFYADGATVPGADFDISSCPGSGGDRLVECLRSKGVHLFRTIATDDILADSLVRELKLRGVAPGPRLSAETAEKIGKGEPKTPPEEQHIALISELDTLYGRTFPDTLQSSFAKGDKLADCKNQNQNCQWIYRLSYLRGLDGALPQPAQYDGKGNDGGKDGQSNSSPATQKDQAKTVLVAKPSELPFGQDQYDYLRRLARSLKDLDDDLKSKGGGLKAIGVLGTDVFDKLLVLRALKPLFPEAIFFTTDFDAGFEMATELQWTRNLLIASSFGPQLSKEIQGEIPPFRDSYETAAFLATRLAVRDLSPPSPRENRNQPSVASTSPMAEKRTVSVGSAEDKQISVSDQPTDADPKKSAEQEQAEQKQITNWLALPRLFEVGRAGNALALPQSRTGDSSKNRDDDASNKNESDACKDLTDCNSIQPDTDGLFNKIEFRIMVICSAVLFIAWVLALTKLWRHARILNYKSKLSHRRRPIIRVTFEDFAFYVYAILASVIAVLGPILIWTCLNWHEVANWLTEDGLGEPMRLSQGVSIWPSIVMRCMSSALCLLLIFRAWTKLESNLHDISKEFRISPSLREIMTAFYEKNEIKTGPRWHDRIAGWLERVGNCFRIKKGTFDRGERWKRYVLQGRSFARLCRVVTCVVVMILFALFLCLIFGFPSVPHRGEISAKLYTIATLADVLLMLFLIFFVADATLFCYRFVKELTEGKIQWPEVTKLSCKRNLSLYWIKHDRSILDDLINVRFIAKRTSCINNLIYYPFAIIALTIFSRSTIFANFPVSWPILIPQGISLVIVIACAIMLNRIAEKARDIAKRHLSDEITKAKILPKEGRSLQLQSLSDRVTSLREGAFLPFLKQPIVGALLLPVTSAGWTTMLESGVLANL